MLTYICNCITFGHLNIWIASRSHLIRASGNANALAYFHFNFDSGPMHPHKIYRLVLLVHETARHPNIIINNTDRNRRRKTIKWCSAQEHTSNKHRSQSDTSSQLRQRVRTNQWFLCTMISCASVRFDENWRGSEWFLSTWLSIYGDGNFAKRQRKKIIWVNDVPMSY